MADVGVNIISTMVDRSNLLKVQNKECSSFIELHSLFLCYIEKHILRKYRNCLICMCRNMFVIIFVPYFI